jgi:Tfp pilus assembly protein FimV
MADYDAFHERGRSLEEDYFRKKNRELIEKMSRDARDERLRREMAAQVGASDPEMLQELQKLGFTPETVSLLPLVPLVQVAWADGDVADAERSAIFKLARTRGITESSAAHHQLSAWLADRPAAEVFASATRLIRGILDAPGGDHSTLSGDELVAHCESIAAAAGGLFGLHKISAEERALITSLAHDLKARQA